MGNVEETKKYIHLDQLSTQKLEDILRADLELQESSDPDMVLYIMEVIEKRENGKSLENRADAERALKEFHELYNASDDVDQLLYPANTDSDKPLRRSEMSTPQTKNHHFLRRLFISAAAVAIIAIFLVPPALGYETFSEMVGRWTESAFYFIRKDSIGSFNNPWKEELDAYGIPVSVLPTKIPEGFELQKWDVDEQEISGNIRFSACYTKDDMYFLILVTRYSRPLSLKIEKDGTKVEEYQVGDTTYYLFENLQDHVAAWHVDTLECTLYGNISTDDLKMMIDSIEVRTR